MLGDIHEYQSFELNGVERMAFSGSILQNNYGESIDKGYLIWNMDTCQHERRFIPNDYGFCKISITKGEDWTQRLEESLRFSLNKKKTKITIELEDDEENYSVEKISQIEKWVRNRYGCEVVNVDFKAIFRDKELADVNTDDVDITNSADAEKVMIEFLKQNDYDNIDDVVELGKEIDAKLNYTPTFRNGLRIEFNKMEVSNLLSFPLETTIFDFDKLKGVTLIAGKNYNGKSNILKALVWIMYQNMLGGGEPHRLVNMYTGVNKAIGRLFFTIENIRYYIARKVTVKPKKDGTYDVVYGVEYKYEKYQEDVDGNMVAKWIDAESEEAATEKKEIKKMINEALGTFDDFVKIALQGGREDYLSLKQQPKNDLVNKFLSLEIYRDRQDEANETFKKIKLAQKVLGDPVEIEKSIKDTNDNITAQSLILDGHTSEKDANLKSIDGFTAEILKFTQSLHKIEKLEETNKEDAQEKINSEEKTLKVLETSVPVMEEWLKNNLLRELPADVDTSQKLEETDASAVEIKINLETNNMEAQRALMPPIEEWLNNNFIKELSADADTLVKSVLESSLTKEQEEFSSEKKNYVTLEKWINDNPKREESDVQKTENDIANIREKLVDLGNKLKLSKGEKCVTCGHISHEPDLELEKKLTTDIERENGFLDNKQLFLKLQKENIAHNNKFDKEKNRLDSIKNSLTTKKLSIDSLKKNIDICSKKDEIVMHNAKIEFQNKKLSNIKYRIELCKSNIERLREVIVAIGKHKLYDEVSKHNSKVIAANTKLTKTKSDIETIAKRIEKLKGQIDLLEKNKKFIEENVIINKNITSKEEDIKNHKIMNLQLDVKIKQLSGDIRIWQNNVENFSEKLNQIKNAERVYKKYSVYLQAVGRDGVPASIIRKKLPIINHKINSLLKGMVNYKVEMYMKPQSGDIGEFFYFSDSKVDALPISMGSGSQKFMTSIAIGDALHFVSQLIKPSFRAIDEGFDTIDSEAIMELGTMFSYLRNKYKNVWVITHRAEVKDFVDNTIQVSKTKTGISDKVLAENPEASVSQFN
jgi:DNA repair exonuclease SbcCD ATPase subunit